MEGVFLTHYQSPVGWLTLGADESGLRVCSFGKQSRPSKNIPPPPERHLREATAALDSYWKGNLNALSQVIVNPSGTPFQRKVWKLLRKVRPGVCASYSQIARRTVSPGAARAVGSACAKNPICLFVPCHRIISQDGSIGQFSGGCWRKELLLSHEKADGLRKRR